MKKIMIILTLIMSSYVANAQLGSCYNEYKHNTADYITEMGEDYILMEKQGLSVYATFRDSICHNMVIRHESGENKFLIPLTNRADKMKDSANMWKFKLKASDGLYYYAIIKLIAVDGTWYLIIYTKSNNKIY